MKKKSIILFSILTILSSCNSKELIFIDINEFLAKDFNCDPSDGNFDFIDHGSTTLSLAKLNYVEDKIYMPSSSVWVDSERTNLKGYDNHIRYIRVNYTIIDDFYGKKTEGLTINIMYYLNKDYKDLYDYKTVYNFFNSYDKMIIYYSSILCDVTYFYAINSQPEADITNVGREAILDHKTFIPVVDDKLSMSSLYNFYSKLNIHTQYDNDKFADELTISEFKDEAKNIQEKSKDWEFNYCG